MVTTIFDKVFLLSWHVYATGMRNSCEVLISIDTVKALAGGIKFFKSANNVILSPGNEEGFIRPVYFKTAITLEGGKRESLDF